MIDVVNHCYDFILMLFNDGEGNRIAEFLKTMDAKQDWEDPTGFFE